MEGVAFGWLIRGIHHWGSTLMVIVVFVHMLRVFVTASYNYPRELTWLIGVGLLLATLGMGFSGYMLPWNQRAYSGPIDQTAPGWDEQTMSLGMQYLGSQNPFSLSPDADGFRTDLMDFSKSQPAKLSVNPYAYANGQFTNNPLLNDMSSFMTGKYNELGSATFNPPKVGFHATPMEYDSVFTPEVAAKWGLSGGIGAPPTATASLGTASQAGMIDPSAAIKAAQDLVSKDISPGVTASLSSSGMGRSGAEAEIISERGTQVALPIAQRTGSLSYAKKATAGCGSMNKRVGNDWMVSCNALGSQFGAQTVS